MLNAATIKCNKCQKVTTIENSRTYHLALKNNINPNSWLAKADKIVLCLPCDNARTTNLIQYLQ